MDSQGRVRDNFGGILPSRPNVLTFFNAMPWLLRYFDRKVPDGATFKDTDGDVEVIEVACPCGETPRVPIGSIEECKCERFYFATPLRVLCANSPHSPHYAGEKPDAS